MVANLSGRPWRRGDDWMQGKGMIAKIRRKQSRLMNIVFIVSKELLNYDRGVLI